MEFFWLVLKGMFMGISNIIPGVSGGTMAVSLGIYDDLIFSVTRLFKERKKSMKFLLPLGIGLIFGILFFSRAIEFLLAKHAFITSSAFIGLILGGLPMLTKEFKKILREKNEKFSIKHGIVFLFFLIFVTGFSLMQEPAMSMEPLIISAKMTLILFSLGVITSTTMIIPGVSGSLVLMILGYYYPLIQLINVFFQDVFTLNWEKILMNLFLILPFSIGILMGFFLISKFIEFLFLNFPSMTYSGILGLVIASPFTVLYHTKAFLDLAQANILPTFLIGGVLLFASFYSTFQLGKLTE